jgi:transcriptional regulator with XRE-family HTH domain
LTTPVQQARDSLGARLREIRKDARLTARELAAASGIRHIEAMYHEYRRQMQAGMKHLQESSIPLYERTNLFRIYDTTVVPGLFTTAEYAAALFRFWQAFMGLKDDVDAAVEARMERQWVLYTGDRQFRVVIEEQVIRTRVGDADVMTGQLALPRAPERPA